MLRSFIAAIFISLSITGLAVAAQNNTQHDFSKIRFKFTSANGVSTMVVSCIDFRLRTELENYMVDRLGPDSYDEVALAGAALGVLNDHFPNWNTTFRQNLDIAIKLHGVKTVIFIDHRDCGAYKMIVGANCCNDPIKEKHAHEIQMDKVRKYMKKTYPDLKLETLLMNLDGTVETLGPKTDQAGMQAPAQSPAAAQ